MEDFHFRHAIFHIRLNDTGSRILLCNEILDFPGQHATGIVSGIRRTVFHERQHAGSGDLHLDVTFD